ncbi:MAG: hypothetical protein EBV69_04855, partial [Oxalobacteraceae bacterium]|nr:hypothetical protein [Oxalobacteraceae bacterium]
MQTAQLHCRIGSVHLLPTKPQAITLKSSLETFNPTQKANTLTALSYISTVLDIKFLSSRTADQSNTFAFALNNQTNSAGYAQYPDDTSSGSDVFLNNKDYNATLNPGTDGAQTLIHEIGHALGLKHPFDEKDADGDVATPPYLQG